MPLITIPKPPVKDKQEPFVSERPYQGMEVKTERTPVSRLLVYVRGTPWPVTYYHQLVRTDEESSANQASRDPLYQQYQRISGFEFKVTQPLTSDFDQTDAEHAMTGESNIYPSIIPIKGDMFVADLGDGRAGVFSIEEVNQLAIFADTTYSVKYQVVEFLTKASLDILEKKVVKRTFFVKDHVLTGQDPLVVEEEFMQIEILRAGVEKLKRLYYSTVYVREVNTFLVPKQTNPTYDPFMMEAMEIVFPNQERTSDERLTKYNCGGDTGFKVNTLWDCILNRDTILFKQIQREFDCIPTRAINDRPMLGSIRFSPLIRVMFPKDRQLLAGYMEGGPVEVQHYPIDSPYSQTEWEQIDLRYLVRRQILNGLGPVKPCDMAIPTVHPVGMDSFYVMSEYFYNRAEYGQSKMELQLWSLLDGRTLDKSVLVELLNDAPDWGPLEQYYYVPILVILIQYGVRGA